MAVATAIRVKCVQTFDLMKVVPVTLEHVFAFLLALCGQLQTNHDIKPVYN